MIHGKELQGLEAIQTGHETHILLDRQQEILCSGNWIFKIEKIMLHLQSESLVE